MNEYLNIVRSRSLLEAVASSLTELFSRDLITLRMEKMRQHYPWLSGGLDYFEARLTQAPEDAKFAINYVYENAKTRAEQELAIQALRDKCDILWAQLDALYFAYVQPGWPPPGAFHDGGERRPWPAPSDTSQPRLATGCRWGAATKAGAEESHDPVPRGRDKTARHRAASAGTVRWPENFRRDHHRVAETVRAADPEKIRSDISAFLEQLQRKRIVDY